MSDYALQELENKIDTLIRICTNLKNENKVLIKERDALRTKNSLAKTRVETIIKRIKIMEMEND
jgi:uncharacterized protein (TIGR02449 family)